MMHYKICLSSLPMLNLGYLHDAEAVYFVEGYSPTYLHNDRPCVVARLDLSHTPQSYLGIPVPSILLNT